MNKKKFESPGLYGRRSIHIGGMDPFTIGALKHIAWARGETVARFIEGLIDDDLISQYPDLSMARDQELFSRELSATQHGIAIEDVPGLPQSDRSTP